jgi:hypothetical protein
MKCDEWAAPQRDAAKRLGLKTRHPTLESRISYEDGFREWRDWQHTQHDFVHLRIGGQATYWFPNQETLNGRLEKWLTTRRERFKEDYSHQLDAVKLVGFFPTLVKEQSLKAMLPKKELHGGYDDHDEASYWGYSSEYFLSRYCPGPIFLLSLSQLEEDLLQGFFWNSTPKGPFSQEERDGRFEAVKVKITTELTTVTQQEAQKNLLGFWEAHGKEVLEADRYYRDFLGGEATAHELDQPTLFDDIFFRMTREASLRYSSDDLSLLSKYSQCFEESKAPAVGHSSNPSRKSSLFRLRHFPFEGSAPLFA